MQPSQLRPDRRENTLAPPGLSLSHYCVVRIIAFALRDSRHIAPLPTAVNSVDRRRRTGEAGFLAAGINHYKCLDEEESAQHADQSSVQVGTWRVIHQARQRQQRSALAEPNGSPRGRFSCCTGRPGRALAVDTRHLDRSAYRKLTGEGGVRQPRTNQAAAECSSRRSALAAGAKAPYD